MAYQASVSAGGSPYRRASNVDYVQPSTDPAYFDRSDSWTESRDMTYSRILSAEEFLSVSYLIIIIIIIIIKKAPGRSARHHALNDLVARVFQSPRSRMVLADQMESGPTGFLWCIGRRESH